MQTYSRTYVHIQYIYIMYTYSYVHIPKHIIIHLPDLYYTIVVDTACNSIGTLCWVQHWFGKNLQYFGKQKSGKQDNSGHSVNVLFM